MGDRLERATGQSRRWLLNQARSAGFWIGLSAGAGLLSGVLLMAQAGMLSRILHDAVMEGLGRQALAPWIWALAGLFVARAVLAWGREAAGFEASAAIRQQVRMDILVHLDRLGPAFLAGRRTGALSAAVMEQVEGLDGFFARYLPQLALAVTLPAGIAAFVFPKSWAAAGMLLITAPLIPLFMVLVGMGAETVSQRHFVALSRMSAHFLDTLQGLATLKIFLRSRSETAAIARVSSTYRQKTMGVLRIAFLSSAILEFFSAIAIALVAVYLGMGYLGYHAFGTWGRPLDLADGFFILLLAPEFYQPLRDLGVHYHARAEAVGAAREILNVLDVPLPPISPRPRAFRPTGGVSVVFQDVGLTYPPAGRPALEGVSFTLDPGETVALVGESGSGKSTVMGLILGFSRPDRGRILVCDAPLDRLDPAGWREYLAWIGQDPVLFHGTIRENIRMGAPRAPAEAVAAAALAARVTAFTDRLPGGLDTPVGERGYGLSKGQVQRIALARAFLKNAPLLLLDEPTAGLDLENEHLVAQAIRALSQGKTVLTVGHRMAAVEGADRILVMDLGRIVQQGPPGILAAAEGPYRRLRQGMTREGGP